MILYATTSHPSLTSGDAVIPCPQRLCRLSGFTGPHICFSTEPISGRGQYVFSVDLPEADVAPYEYEDEFRPERQARFFAIPMKLLQKVTPQRQTFEEITGTPWNEWVVPLLDRRRTRDHRFLGKWSIVWMSRPGIATTQIAEKSPDFFSITLRTTTDFNPETDYLMVEIHEESEHPSRDQREDEIKETWRLETLAGSTPQWAIFPSAWQDWVFDPDVTRSAIDFIEQHVPHARALIDGIAERESKHNLAREWRRVSNEVGRTLTQTTGRYIDLGKLAGHSWTAVNAMPHRIAMRMSQHLGIAWNPPYPKPEFENPEESGRIVLANLYGAFPTRGPGVDHNPQDRVFSKRQGELGDRTPFVSSRKVEAALTA